MVNLRLHSWADLTHMGKSNCCRRCGILRTTDAEHEECPESVAAWLTHPIARLHLPKEMRDEVRQHHKVACIKALREVAGETMNSLADTKALVEGLLDGETAEIPVKENPEVVQQKLGSYGIGVTMLPSRDLSGRAVRVLEALQKHPALMAEVRTALNEGWSKS